VTLSFKKATREDGLRRCIIWTGCVTKGGYGKTMYKGKSRLAHRKAWMLVHGPIPASHERHGTLCVLHKCDRPSCVNVQHMFLGTQRDNVKDMDMKGRRVFPYVLKRLRGERRKASR
jgi:hypothetical protein